MSLSEDKLNSAWWALRIGLGVGPFLAGLDKFFNLLANWESYLNPMVERMLPMSGATFMHIVGVIEMIVGLMILTRWTRIGSYIAMLWLVAIAVNLIFSGRFFDVAVRDLEMAVAAYTLARLTEVRSAATDPNPSPMSGHASYSAQLR
jgi:uncharacterized membrane protein YphA (DoxX/SURF4 family)